LRECSLVQAAPFGQTSQERFIAPQLADTVIE
jgi:hypothetical protein